MTAIEFTSSLHGDMWWVTITNLGDRVQMESFCYPVDKWPSGPTEEDVRKSYNLLEAAWDESEILKEEAMKELIVDINDTSSRMSGDCPLIGESPDGMRGRHSA